MEINEISANNYVLFVVTMLNHEAEFLRNLKLRYMSLHSPILFPLEFDIVFFFIFH